MKFKQENEVYYDALKMLAWIVFAMAACRVSNGLFALVIVALGIFAALTNKPGWAICHYIILPFMIATNYTLLPKSGFAWTIALRIGTLAIALALSIGAASRHGNHRLPFACMLPFLLIAGISSATGYAPPISYMKLANYFFFLLGVWLGTQNIQDRPKDVRQLRAMFLAMICFVVYGSILVWPFPAISYAVSLRYMGDASIAELNAAGRQMMADGDKTLFSGVMCHSQWMAPFLAISFGLLLCDMLFIEKRFRKPHALTLLIMLPMLYMTRSRVAFITSAAAVAIISFYTVNRITIPIRIKLSLRSKITACLLGLVICIIPLEVKNNTMSKWLRKTQDVSQDTRGLSEAMTDSRMGLIEASMYDFRRNPMWGMGFQVDSFAQELWAHSNGMIFSAPIEKGVLPAMVLGETGVMGAICFLFFLVAFYCTCASRKLYITITMFSLLFVSNLGEASFFSPGGLGGPLWIISVVGGFVLDTVLLCNSRRALQQMGVTMMGGVR